MTKATTSQLKQNGLLWVWYGMRDRCYNANSQAYKYYGARGITICEEWLGNPIEFMYWALENGHAGGLDLDRIDNDKGYSPENCRFVTHHVNCCNRKIKHKNISGFLGVLFVEKTQRFRATLSIKGKFKHLGFYENPLVAAMIRDDYITENNLPNRREKLFVDKNSNKVQGAI